MTIDQASFDAGIAQERDRVLALLRGGDASGCHELARTAIGDGRNFEAVSAEFLSAARARREQQLAQLDSETALDAIAGAEPPTTTAGGGLADQVADRVARRVQQRNPKPGARQVLVYDDAGEAYFEQVAR